MRVCCVSNNMTSVCLLTISSAPEMNLTVVCHFKAIELACGRILPPCFRTLMLESAERQEHEPSLTIQNPDYHPLSYSFFVPLLSHFD